MLSFKSSDMQNISVKASTEWALTNQNGYGLQTTAVSYRYKPAACQSAPEPRTTGPAHSQVQPLGPARDHICRTSCLSHVASSTGLDIESEFSKGILAK